MDICTVCSTKTPRFRRTRSPWRHSSAMRPRGWSAWRAGSGGTTQSTTAMPASARAQVRPKMPGSPPQAASRGLSTRASANMRPMLPPTMAMALVRTLSRVRSASSAVTAAETAPAPCRPRPHIRPSSESAVAASRLPAAKTSSPATMTRLRPKRSEARPRGSWNTAWVSPYRPMARPIMAGSSPPGYLRASSANTGSTRNRPSMRSAKISARLALERRSCEVMRPDAAEEGLAPGRRGRVWGIEHGVHCCGGKQSAILAHRPALRGGWVMQGSARQFCEGAPQKAQPPRRPSRHAVARVLTYHGGFAFAGFSRCLVPTRFPKTAAWTGPPTPAPSPTAATSARRWRSHASPSAVRARTTSRTSTWTFRATGWW